MHEAVSSLSSVAWICTSQRRLLVVRTGGRDAFYVPGAKPEPHETPEAALGREVQEELGVSLDPETLRLLATFTGPAHGVGQPVELRMQTYVGEGAGTIVAGKEIVEVAWVSSAERDRCAPVARRVVAYLVAQGFID
jgi:8-oxo-dGTP diphosphatase